MHSVRPGEHTHQPETGISFGSQTLIHHATFQFSSPPPSVWPLLTLILSPSSPWTILSVLSQLFEWKHWLMHFWQIHPGNLQSLLDVMAAPQKLNAAMKRMCLVTNWYGFHQLPIQALCQRWNASWDDGGSEVNWGWGVCVGGLGWGVIGNSESN